MYRIISHTADIALEIEAESREALFIDAAAGWKSLVLEDAHTAGRQARTVDLTSFSLEDLLVQWLGECSFFLDPGQWVFHAVETMTLKATDSGWRLSAAITGEPRDLQRHYIYSDIKAVTYHQLDIRQNKGRFTTRVVFDI